MYLIDITIHADRALIDKAGELLAGHRAWFTKQAQAGYFLLVGPYRDKKMSGLVIAQADSREVIDKIITEDAYYPAWATYDIHEFQANIIADSTVDYKGK